RDAVEHILVGNAEVQIVALLLDQALTQHLLDDVVAHLGVVEDRGIDPLGRAPQSFLLVADGVRKFDLGDLAAVVLRDSSRAATAAEIIVDSEERERNHDQRKNELRDSLVLMDEIEHLCCPLFLLLPTGCEKGELAFALGILAEWT